MKSNNFLYKVIVAGILVLDLSACTPQNKQFGASLLSSTGLVTESQANTAFAVGEKLGKAASGLSEEQEYYLGRGVSAMILAQYPLYQNPGLTAYLNRVGGTVAAMSDRPETFTGYHFAVLDTEEINALSAPGGFVFVSRGLMQRVPNEDALAAVLAHEVGHIVKGHGVKAISRANLTEALTMVGKEAASSYAPAEVQQLTSVFSESVSDVFNTIVKDGYSRSQEYEADAYAADLLNRVGYGQSALISMLQSIDGATTKRGGWFDTHPSPKKRISELDGDKLLAQGNTPGFDIRVSRFKKSVKL